MAQGGRGGWLTGIKNQVASLLSSLLLVCYDEGKKLTGMTFEYASRKCACLNCSCNFAMRIDGSMRHAAVAICDCTNG